MDKSQRLKIQKYWSTGVTYSRTRISAISIVLRWSERARNDLYNPEFITLMITVMNSGLKREASEHVKNKRLSKVK